MEKKSWFKVIALAGLCLGGIASLLSDWANSKEQDSIIEEKVNEAFANYESEKVEES